jgi:putative oxidoreductase
MLADQTRLRATWEPRMLSVLRIVSGLLFVEHGLNKFFGFPPGTQQRAYDLFTLVPGLAGILETFGGILLILGLFTRPVAFMLSGEMAFAYFMAHQPRAIYPYSNGGTLAVLYCFVFLYLFVAGGGEWSLDRVLRRGATLTTRATATRAA